MRRFAVCFSSLGIFAASIVSGCSSDNATGDSGVDAQTSVDGASTMDTSTTDTSSTDSPVGTDAGKEAAACVPVDASVATIPTGDPQWTCFQSMCATELSACAADCACNDAILGALACSAAAGSNTATCFLLGFASIPTTLSGPLAGCLQSKRAACTPEGGAEGGAEGGSGDGGVDGATEGGGGDGGTDGGVTDAPTTG